MHPKWIPVDAVIRIHDHLVRTFGGVEGLPHPGYLESAIMAPQQHLYYTNSGADLFDLAAVYLYHIARGHAFVDGNKRTAYTTAMAFLLINGVDVLLPENDTELAEITIAVSLGKLDKAELASALRRLPNTPSGEEVQNLL